MPYYVWLIGLALIASTVAHAQEAPPLAAGSRVRVSVATPDADPARLVGTLVALTPSNITIRTPEAGEEREVQIPLTTVARIEVSREQRTRWLRGLGIGFFGGAAGGAALGYVLDVDGNDLQPELAAALGAFYGGLGGAVIGTIAGLATRVDHWQRVLLPGIGRIEPVGIGGGLRASLQMAL